MALNCQKGFPKTLKIHKLERKVDPNSNIFINFYNIAEDNMSNGMEVRM